MKVKVTIVVVLVAIVLVLFVKLHFIRDEGGGGYVLSRNDEAYLFMYDRPIGYRIRILEYLLEPIKEYFYAPAIPTDDEFVLTALRITPAGLERHIQESTVFIRDFTPIDDEIYAHCPGGICKWTGTKFQLLSDQEERNFGGDGHLSKAVFVNVDGWSKREIDSTSVGDDPKHYEFSINLNDGVTLLVRGGNPVSVDFLRPDHASERVWYHEQSTRRVGTAEYEQVFHQH